MASVTAASTSAISAPPPELEQNLALLTAHRSVLGVMILSHTPAASSSSQPQQQQQQQQTPQQPANGSRASKTTIVRHSGVVFEGELGRKYAGAVARIVDACRIGLEEVGNTEGVRLYSINGACKGGTGPDWVLLLALVPRADCDDYDQRAVSTLALFGFYVSLSLDMAALATLQDDIRFMRLRTKRHELMISPRTSSSMLQSLNLMTSALLNRGRLHPRSFTRPVSLNTLHSPHF